MTAIRASSIDVFASIVDILIIIDIIAFIASIHWLIEEGVTSSLPVAIIGGGPVGLAAAAHLIERGERAILFEAGSTAGANVLDWAQVRMFSPWAFNMDAASLRLLEATGWSAPAADELPTGAELYQRYLRPLAEMPALRAIIRTEASVVVGQPQAS